MIGWRWWNFRVLATCERKFVEIAKRQDATQNATPSVTLDWGKDA